MERLKRNLLLALVLGVGIYLVMAFISGFGDLREALDNINWGVIAIALGLVAVSYSVRYVRWAYYLRLLKVQVPLKMNIAIFAAGLAMTISPGKFGEVLKSVFIRDVTGDPIARTAPAVVAERVTDATGMLAWGLIGALAFNFGPGVLFLFLAITVLGIAVLRSKRLSVLAERLLKPLPFVGRFAHHAADFHGASNQLLALRPLGIGSLISFVAWGIECLAVYLSAIGVGVQEPFLKVVFIFAVSSIAGAVSMLPGGLGAAEASMAGMFKAVAGIEAGLAIALTIVIRLVTLWFAVFVGMLGLLALRKLSQHRTNLT